MVADGSKILRASAEYLAQLQQIALSAKELADSEEALDEEACALLNFDWLCAKYELFWFDDVRAESQANLLMPDCPVFTPLDFERLVQSTLLLVQGKFYKTTAATGDGGIDLTHQECLDSNWGAYATTLVQCKLYRGFVPISEVRDFFGVISAHTATGIFVTTGKQTSQAHSFLPLANASPHSNTLHLLERAEWDALLHLAKQCQEVLSSAVDLEADHEITTVNTELSSLRRKAHKMIFAPKILPIQQKLF